MNEQGARNLFIGEALVDQTDDLHLALRKIGARLGTAPGGMLEQAAEEGDRRAGGAAELAPRDGLDGHHVGQRTGARDVARRDRLS